MNDPLSAFEITYTGMSEDDRENIATDIDAILKKSLADIDANLNSAIKKAVDEATAELLANPWSDWIEENGDRYGFISSLSDGIFRTLCGKSPKGIPEYKLSKLVTEWREKFPEDFAEVCNEEILKEIENLKGLLEFERGLNKLRGCL